MVFFNAFIKLIFIQFRLEFFNIYVKVKQAIS